MITAMAGPNGSASAGQIIDVERSVADSLVGGGYAVLVDNPRESQAMEPPETAAMESPSRNPIAQPERQIRKKKRK